MTKVYVLAGKAKSGKDSAGKIIERYYGNQKVIKYSPTMYLKDYIMKISTWNGKDETKPRDLLQSLGAELKERYPNFFIKRMEEDIRYLSLYTDVIIITGIRLIKELEFLKNQFNGILIKLEKNEDNGLTIKQKNDITETEVDSFNDFDYVIKNNGNLNELEKEVLKIVRSEENEY